MKSSLKNRHNYNALQTNIKRSPQVLLHFHQEEYITKSIMMCMYPFASSNGLFLVSLNSRSSFRLRHFLEVKLSRTTLPALMFGLASEQKISHLAEVASHFAQNAFSARIKEDHHCLSSSAKHLHFFTHSSRSLIGNNFFVPGLSRGGIYRRVLLKMH